MLFDAVIKIFWLYGHFGVKFKIDDIGFIFYEHQVIMHTSRNLSEHKCRSWPNLRQIFQYVRNSVSSIYRIDRSRCQIKVMRSV